MKYKSVNDGEEIIKEDYSKKLILSSTDFGGDGHGLQTVKIPPQTKQREHYHNIQTEVFYILKGECHIFINGQEYISKPGDAFVCSPGDKHYLWNQTDEEFELVVFKINKPEDNDDTVWLES